MNVALHVVSSDSQLDYANVEKDEIDQSIIHIQFDVDIKADSHIIFLIIYQVKVDNKRVVRCQNANVA